MSNVIILKTNSFKFNYIHFLFIIGFVLLIFILTNILIVKNIAETAPNFRYEDAEELMEEIYDAGTITEAVKNIPLDAAIVKKMNKEIERQLAKTTDHSGCEVYKLVAIPSTEYPVLGYRDEIIGFEYLSTGETWKVGMTCSGEEIRYQGDNYYKSRDGLFVVPKTMLTYETIFKGTYKQAIISEKILIYTYPLWSGHPKYAKPFGNKIFR